MKQDDEGADEITKNDENEKEKKKRESTERRKKLAEFHRSHPYNVPKKLNLNSPSKESLARLQIQPDDVYGVYNPKADGHCGWCSVSFVTNEDEEAYDTVKEAMRSIMMHKVDFYQDHGIDVDRAAKRLKKIGKIGSNDWFETIDCPQLVADLYQRPIQYFSFATGIFLGKIVKL
ncbi:hypothetical protein BJV82DRAFT_584432 [Fennellomyces sp. T-0311]|nr:hypothetical protein BJV82DRAFT_584432 [Fennellomyces sp. T-0311]